MLIQGNLEDGNRTSIRRNTQTVNHDNIGCSCLPAKDSNKSDESCSSTKSTSESQIDSDVGSTPRQVNNLIITLTLLIQDLLYC